MNFLIQKSLFICFLSVISLNVSALEKLEIEFATDANYHPFEFIAEDKTIQGFDIDIANAICKQVNLQCTFKHYRFDDLLIMLPFNRYDAVIAALDITDERLKIVDFTDSYYKVPPVFISREQLKGELALKEKLIGVQANTSNQNYLIKATESKGSFIIPYFSSKAALNDLLQYKIDVVFADFAVINQFLSEQKGDTDLLISRNEVVFTEQFSEGYGIAVKKGNEDLRKRLNQGLKLIIENGTYEDIFKKYFP